jgi:hypothetical protein
VVFLQRCHGNLASSHSALVDEIAAEHGAIEMPTKPVTVGRTNLVPTPRSTELRTIWFTRPVHIAARCHGCDMPNGRSSTICDFCHAPLRVTA